MNMRSERAFTIVFVTAYAMALFVCSIGSGESQEFRRRAKELAAIRMIGAIHSVQTQYRSQFGRFAMSLAELGPPANGRPSANAADLIPPELTLGRKYGYLFLLTGTSKGYEIWVVPERENGTGRRTFRSDQTGAIQEFVNPTPK